MKIKYIDLYNHLRTQEQLNAVQAVRSIMEVRNLTPATKRALAEWSQTGQCSLTVEGVSFNELTTTEGMTPVRALKMLDWLSREPLLALRYLSQRRLRANLAEFGSAKVADTVTGETDKSDIELTEAE